jgi:uncharacterized protein (TIGR00255 family)
MTGFASAARESARGQLAVELKSVNHRYLEVAFRIPDEWRALEPALREAVSGKAARGKFDCRVSFTPRAQGPRSAKPDPQALAALRAASGDVLAAFPDARPLSVSEVLHWPGVLAEEDMPADAVREELGALFATAVGELQQSREREGAKLERFLIERLDAIEALVREAAPLVPGAVRAFRERLSARIAEAALAPNDERLQQEVALYAARIDVEEELSRLGTHVAEVRRVLARGGPCGKRLDFLCQELNREANTLGSKSVASELSRVSVDLKVLVEQMREQVQNVE